MINPTTNLVDPFSIFQIFRGVEYVGNRFSTSDRPERFKKYTGPCIRFKTSVYKEEADVSPPLSGARMLERVLLPSFGMTSVKFYGHQSELLWSFPSAGGCYPVEVYVMVRSLDGVESGLYYYSALQTSLYRVAGPDVVEHLYASLLERDHHANFYFILSIVPWRTCWKYSYKGYRFSLMDSGHVIANFQLILQSMGLEHSVYTCTKSRELKPLLKLDAYEEPLAIIAVRSPTAETGGSLPVLACLNDQTSLSEACVPFQETDIHLFDWRPVFDFQDKVNRSLRTPEAKWLARHPLPAEWNDYNQVLQLIINRRSSTGYASLEISNADFLRMLDFIYNLETYSSFYMIVHAVAGIKQGIYHFDGQLTMMAAGNFRDASASLCLGQTFIRDCSVLFFFVMDVSWMKEEDLPAYQQTSIAAGILGQMLYLKSQELQLEYSAIGGYYDEEVRELFQFSPHFQIIYAGACGRNDPNLVSKRKNDRYALNIPKTIS